MGGKAVSELIDANVSIAWDGINGKVTGKIKQVEGWAAFSSVEDEQSGHYFPFELSERYEGKKITVIGAHQKTAQDRKWVIRLDELMQGSKKLTAKVGSTVIFTLDFTGATMDGA